MDITLSQSEIEKVLSTLSVEEIRERLESDWRKYDRCTWENSWITLKKDTEEATKEKV